MKYGLVAIMTIALLTQPLISQSSAEGKRIVANVDAVHVTAVNAVSMPMAQLISQLSDQTKVAFCAENREDRGHSTLSSLLINLSVNPGDDLRTILDRLHH